jgi:hypothetical protein
MLPCMRMAGAWMPNPIAPPSKRARAAEGAPPRCTQHAALLGRAAAASWFWGAAPHLEEERGDGAAAKAPEKGQLRGAARGALVVESEYRGGGVPLHDKQSAASWIGLRCMFSGASSCTTRCAPRLRHGAAQKPIQAEPIAVATHNVVHQPALLEFRRQARTEQAMSDQKKVYW